MVALISAASAAETEDRIVPVTRPPENTAISASKPEYDSIKSSRDPALQQKGDVPRLSVPEMPAASAGSGWTPPSKAIPEKKSPNWLVDAMEKQDDERKPRNRDRSDRERDALPRNTGDPLRDELKQRLDGTASETQPGETQQGGRKVPTTAVANPLTGFLGGWMTPQDYALLKPGLDQAALPAGNRDTVNVRALQLPGGSLATGTTGLGASLAGSVAPILPPKTKENPFLQTLAAPPVPSPVAVSGMVSPGALSPPKPVVTAMPPPPLIEPPKSQVPDFAKPAQDERYFKQLKRF